MCIIVVKKAGIAAPSDEMFENMFPNATKLEMFARNARDGWDCWGNEV